jgi:hypothetical protein
MINVEKLTEKGNNTVGETFGDNEINAFWRFRVRFWARKLAVITFASLPSLEYNI